MALTVSQRLDRVRVRLEELFFWREREAVDIGGWTFEGEPIAVGQPWPHREGVVHFDARATVPTHWPLSETRLQLDLGGEGLVSVDYPDGTTVRFGNDVNHHEFPVRAHSFAPTEFDFGPCDPVMEILGLAPSKIWQEK